MDRGLFERNLAAQGYTADKARRELESIIRDARSNAQRSGDPEDAEIARKIEADAREILACLPAPRRKLKKSNKAKKRKAFKHCIRMNADAPILSQVQAVVR